MAALLATIWLGSTTHRSVAQAPDTVSVGGNVALGNFLVGPSGLTLYVFSKDVKGTSNCAGGCEANWPPLTVTAGVEPTGGPGVNGTLGVHERADGSRQVTLDGWPLYFWKNDSAPGDANGQNVGNVWFVVSSETQRALSTVAVSEDSELGDFLAAANGMTLYVFTKDEPGTSNCYGQCEANWPPLTVAAGVDATAGPGATGELETAERTDGALQVTYNGSPLYFWANDSVPGDTTGHGVGSVWFVASSAAAMQAAPAAPASGNGGIAAEHAGPPATLASLIVLATLVAAAGARSLTAARRTR